MFRFKMEFLASDNLTSDMARIGRISVHYQFPIPAKCSVYIHWMIVKLSWLCRKFILVHECRLPSPKTVTQPTDEELSAVLQALSADNSSWPIARESR